MAVWQKFLNNRGWMVAAAAGAVAVFIATFAIVSALQGEDDPASPAVSAALAPPGTPDQVTPAVPPGPVPETEPSADTPAAAATSPPPERVVRHLPLPAFDEESLIYGGDGSEGAILGGPGIYNSSAAENRTDWEILIPSAQMKARMVQVGLVGASRALGAPDNPDVIGWWMEGPQPGEPGNVLVAGHRDYIDRKKNVGTGVAWLLPNTQPGDFIIVRDNTARVNHLYVVHEATSLPFDSPDGAQYLRSTDEPILTFVTCEGAFDKDARNYSNRRIVVAHLTDSIPFDE